MGGVHGTLGVIGAIDFNSRLKSRNFSKLTLGDYRCLSRIKRIEGSDILLAGCFGSILIIQFKDNVFNIINQYSNLCDSEIVSMVFYSSHIYYLNSEDTNCLGVIEFENMVDHSELHFREISRCEKAMALLEGNNLAKKEEITEKKILKDESLKKSVNTFFLLLLIYVVNY